MEESKTRMSYGTAGRTSAGFNLPAGRAGMPMLICTSCDLRIATARVRPPDPGTYSDFSDHAVKLQLHKELTGCKEAPSEGCGQPMKRRFTAMLARPLSNFTLQTAD